jgi:hypothetical protein
MASSFKGDERGTDPKQVGDEPSALGNANASSLTRVFLVTGGGNVLPRSGI